MHPTAAKKRLGGVLLALVASLAFAAPALAASTSATTSESLLVTASIALSGVPATITYPDSTAGQNSVATEFTAAVSSNNSTGWQLAVNATDLTSGGNTIAMTNRQFSVAGTGFTMTGGGSPVSYVPGDFVLASRNTGGASNVFLTPRILVPANAAPGSYVGQMVFTASTLP